ncbi:hypothetical protein X758_08205 [Mesorhizobium sp. LSHC416B00]|nr:hypothetical protein X761_19085 [Mesorhizobium sp. LSHC424B00]ESX74058.1 hypothetical protein X758_08205 [Mesorhizobium sp. LSHC416B00]
MPVQSSSDASKPLSPDGPSIKPSSDVSMEETVFPV